MYSPFVLGLCTMGTEALETKEVYLKGFFQKSFIFHNVTCLHYESSM